MLNSKTVTFPTPKTKLQNHDAIIGMRAARYFLEQIYRMEKDSELLSVIETMKKVENDYQTNRLTDHHK